MGPEAGIATMFGIFFIFAFFIALVSIVLWMWMLIDCLTNKELDSNEKLVWTLVIVFTHMIGAIIYFFVGRKKKRLS